MNNKGCPSFGQPLSYGQVTATAINLPVVL